MLKIYTYAGCDTCRNALKFLAARQITATVIPIRETPPTIPELRAMLEEYGGDLRKLFNTSGRDYQALGLAEKLPAMNETEALDLLAANGNLVKRPFLIGKTARRVGFREEEWVARLG